MFSRLFEYMTSLADVYDCPPQPGEVSVDNFMVEISLDDDDDDDDDSSSSDENSGESKADEVRCQEIIDATIIQCLNGLFTASSEQCNLYLRE